MAISLPTAAQAALQTPLNTYSPTSTPLTNTANGYTYTYNTGLGVWTVQGAGGAAVTSISGGTTGLTPAAATSGPVTLGGTLAVANGGTGANTTAGAINNLLPSQAGNTGEYLTTDGTNVSWAPIAAGFPTGTTMPFAQAAAPTGWTQVTSGAYSDSSIRLVTGAGGGTGGSIAFSTLFSSASSYTSSISITSGNVGSTTLSVAQLASHDHASGLTYWLEGGTSGATNDRSGLTSNVPILSGSAGSNAGHTHSLAGVSTTGNFTSNFAVKYVDMIVASKN